MRKVPYIDQSVKYPTGCESVSAVMLLKYLGYEITVDEFIKNCLECRDMEMRDGKLYGPDPNEYFCGSPYDEESFGIYAKGLLKALEKTFNLQMSPAHRYRNFWKNILIRGCRWCSGHASICEKKFRDRNGNCWIRENLFAGFRMSIVCCWWGMMRKSITSMTRMITMA